jgi:gephyrin
MPQFATPSAAFKMISIPEALDIVLSETNPLPAETVPFQNAFQHILAADVLGVEPVPGYRASIKDGYAVVSSDGPGEYEIVFEAHAGTAPGTLSPGTVAYISTGGPVPKGADAVVQIEDTKAVDETSPTTNKVKILRQVRPGEDIREIGSDMAAGQIALPAGHAIGAAEVGILATVGAVEVSVHRKPHVAVLSTGDEVMEPSVSKLTPGKIRDANRAMLLAAAAETGAKVTDLGIASDTAEQVEAALDAALSAGADVVLTTGGVSMGDKDFIKPLLERRGTIFFGKVCMKPGKPLTFAKVPNSTTGRNILVFGLPGNPASSLVTFHLVVVPCLRKMEGWADPSLRRIHVRLAGPFKMDPERPEYHRAVVHWERGQMAEVETSLGGDDDSSFEGEFVAESTGGQISSRIMSLKSANALIEVPAHKGTLPAGTRLTALVIGDIATMPQPQQHPILTMKAP